MTRLASIAYCIPYQLWAAGRAWTARAAFDVLAGPSGWLPGHQGGLPGRGPRPRRLGGAPSLACFPGRLREERTGGLVTRWEPPNCVAYTWQHDDWAEPTEVEVRFSAEAPGVTRIELEHRAWERLGAAAAEMRDMYENGWPAVMGCFEALAGAA